MPQSAPRTRVILDWGTSSFRALLVDPAGTTIDRVETEDGIQSMRKDAFAGFLQRALAPWNAKHGLSPIYAAGMVGSRNGWVEMPYVPVPAGAAELARMIRRVPLDDGTIITLIPGLTDASAKPFADVMRGEETQLIGFGLADDRIAVLPGTHAKWARIGKGKIQGFQTFVTGEVFGTLSQHSFLSKVAMRPAAPDWAAFAQGVDAVRTDPRPAGLLSHLFSVRTGWLAGKLVPAQMTDYLSGIVVGSEFREASELGWFKPGDTVAIIGGEELMEVYRRTALLNGLTPIIGPEDAAVQGCLAIASIAETLNHAA